MQARAAPSLAMMKSFSVGLVTTAEVVGDAWLPVPVPALLPVPPEDPAGAELPGVPPVAVPAEPDVFVPPPEAADPGVELSPSDRQPAAARTNRAASSPAQKRFCLVMEYPCLF